MKQAEAQFRQARALVAANRANYYPTIGSSPVHHANRRGTNGGRLAAPARLFAARQPRPGSRICGAGFVLSVENAVDNAQVSAADLENVRLSAQALLATDYFLAGRRRHAAGGAERHHRGLSEEPAADHQSLQRRRGIEKRCHSGADPACRRQAQSTDLRVARAQFEHAIAVLTGQPPSALDIAAQQDRRPAAAHSGGAFPRSLLERRPDIAANERLVAAANANVGIAETAYYPTLTLSASAGLLDHQSGESVHVRQPQLVGGPRVRKRLFDFGRRGAAVGRRPKPPTMRTVAAYRQTVLSAFQEVEDDLAALRYLAEEAAQQQEAVAAAEQSLALEIDRYKAGTDSYLNVITTQTIALNDQQTAITILQRRMVAAVDLVKALGGGWDASALPSG